MDLNPALREFSIILRTIRGWITMDAWEKSKFLRYLRPLYSGDFHEAIVCSSNHPNVVATVFGAQTVGDSNFVDGRE